MRYDTGDVDKGHAQGDGRSRPTWIMDVVMPLLATMWVVLLFAVSLALPFVSRLLSIARVARMTTNVPRQTSST